MRTRMWAATLLSSTLALGAATLLFVPGPGARRAEAAGGTYEMVEAWPGVTFDAPIDLAAPRDGTDRLFVVERAGKIKVAKKYRGGQPASPPTVFLDLGSLLTPDPQEKGHGGLLSLAFHPQYAKNGRFFVFYGTGSGSQADPYRAVVAGYHVSANDPNVADPASGQILLSQPKVNLIHFGGGLAFGRDGKLYIGFGEQGKTDDPERIAQDPRVLEGKILRIDVDNVAPGKSYGIPADNPWPQGQGGVRPEIFAYGVRNPWRMSFDRETGLLWLGDPGQKEREDISVVTRGGNMGWAMMEGDVPRNPAAKPDQYVKPTFCYGRDMGRCVIGGQVYRGQRCSGLVGKYVFADHMAGKVWALPVDKDRSTGAPEPLPDVEAVAAIQDDAEGELYFVSLDGGKVFTIAPSR